MLPPSLPEQWAQYRRWVKTRDGFRRALRNRCYGDLEEGTVQKQAFAKGFSLWLKEYARRFGTKPLSAGYLQERLNHFFEYKEKKDLEIPLQAALLAYLNVPAEEFGSWIQPAAPFDIWREAWLGEPEPPNSLDLESYGMRLHRIQPSAATRALNAYRRSWDTAGDGSEDGGLYTSPSSGFAYVVQGSVEVEFLANGKHLLGAGDALLYNSRHPHAFRPQGSETVLLDVTSNLRGGVPSELFLAKWEVEQPEYGDEHVGLDSVRRLIAYALHSTHMPLNSLAKRVTIERRRLKQIAHMEVAPTLSEILEIAHLCRLPEEKLFTPLAQYLETDVLRVQEGIRTCDPADLELLTLETHDAYRNVVAGAEGNGGPTLYEWEMRSVGSPPTLVHGVPDGLEVGLFFVRGPGDPQKSEPADHHDAAPAEELIYVLDGHLGVRLRQGLRPVCEGVLGPGDAVWFSSRLRHSFFAPDGEESRSLHFRQALPARRK